MKHKFAAIDIGSNAVRLLFCNVIEEESGTVFKKAELIRVPIRLGEDAFIKNKISEKKERKLLYAMHAFKHLIKVYDAVSYRACATSAMREAENRWDIIQRIKKETGLKIELIEGKAEADIIFSNHIEEKLDKSQSYLYIDVGGGSTELTLFSKGKQIVSQSFNIGTIRMLHNKIEKEYWDYFKKWIKEITKGYQPVIGIGSGGNINKIFKISRRKENRPISFNKLKSISEILESYSLDERISVLGLNPDRADVIIPASKIYLTVMKQAGIDKMLVPQMGLSDGIIKQLYVEYKQKQSAQKNILK